MIAGIDQGGLGLPDRDYYLKDDEQTKPLRDGVPGVRRASCSPTLGHKPDARRQEAADVIALETEIAKVSQGQGRAPRSEGHVQQDRSRRRRARRCRSFDWDAFWKAVGLKDVKDVDRHVARSSSPALDALLDSDQARDRGART